MELIILLDSIVSGAEDIDKGRKNFAIDGLEHAGRLFMKKVSQPLLKPSKKPKHPLTHKQWY